MSSEVASLKLSPSNEVNDAHSVNADVNSVNLIICFEVSAVCCRAQELTGADREQAAHLVLFDPTGVVARRLAVVPHRVRLWGLRLRPKD